VVIRQAAQPAADPQRAQGADRARQQVQAHVADAEVDRQRQRHQWREGGPVRIRYAQAATREFLRDPFHGREALLAMEVRELGDSSLAVLQRKLEHLAIEFREMALVDAGLPREQKSSVGMLLALRPWVFSLLDSLRCAARRHDRK